MEDYEAFKTECFNKNSGDYGLIIRTGFELVEIKGIDVLVYVPNITMTEMMKRGHKWYTHSMKTYATVHVIARNSKGEFLILQRAIHRTNPGTWNCITGYMQERESAEDAALRELKEETNLEGTLIMTGDPHWSNYDGTKYIIVTSLVEIDDENILKVDEGESQSHAWVTLDDERVQNKSSLVQSLRSVGVLG